MPKNSKKSPTPKASSAKQNWLPLLIAGGAGFLGAFVLLKGCPFSMLSCPAYEKICPVTSTLNQLEKCVDKGNLDSARQCAEKLTDLLQPSMPELAKSAQAISNAQSLPEARKALTAFQTKMKAGPPIPASKKS